MFHVLKGSSAAVFDTLSNSAAIKRLEAESVAVFRIPCARYVAVTDPDRLEPLRGAAGFDWVVVSDARAAEHLPVAAEAADADLFGFDKTSVCAVGEAAADFLRFVQVHADLIPLSAFPESVVRAMEEYSGDELGLEGARVLVLETAESPLSAASAIESAGAVTTRVTVCEPDPGHPGPDAKQRAMIVGGGVDGFYFGSPLDVFDAFRLFARGGVAPADAVPNAYFGDAVTKGALLEFGVAGELIPVRMG